MLRPQPKELVNTITHGAGLLLSVAGAAVLIGCVGVQGDLWLSFGCGVYVSSLVGVYVASTLSHSATVPKQKRFFRILDQAFIYLLIAGTTATARILPLAVAVLVWLVLSCLTGATIALTAAANEFQLHPPVELVTKAADAELPVPFVQAVPFGQGELAPQPVRGIAIDGEPVEAAVRVMNHWPDGSVRFMLVEGVLPPALLQGDSLTAGFTEAPAQAAQRNPIHRVVVDDNRLLLRGEGNTVLATMSLEAAWARITEDKVIYPNEPHYNNAVAQYGWAPQLENLAETPEPRPLQPRVREARRVRDSGVFADYLVQGDGGGSSPGPALQWQLRLRVYRATPVMRWQMTWAMHWDVEEHALTRAAWVLRPADGIASAEIPYRDADQQWLRVSGRRLRLGDGDAYVKFQPNGYGTLVGLRERELGVYAPHDDLHRLLVQSGDWTIGVAVCDLSRLGPSHLLVNRDVIEVASWSDLTGRGMDLRRSTTPDELGIGGGDLHADGQGAAFSLDGALVFARREADVTVLTHAEVMRDQLWFPAALDLYETGALGDRVHPETLGAGDHTARIYRGMQESVYFLILSREKWRWYGALNYGNVRTNFKGIRDVRRRGLHYNHWGHHGRYGWRNGSSDVHGRLLYHGLLLEDRTAILAALDYARTVADVTVKHGSFFAEPDGAADEGGMHRRNKDPWSGGTEPQYTTSWGLYLASWMTGDGRIDQVLEEVRAFTRDVDRQSHSAFRADAWIHRYAETHDQADLDMAVRLIEGSAQVWSGRAEDELDGLASLYYRNFRRVGDGLLTLVNFFEHTGDERYLEAILANVRYHGVGNVDDAYLVAYLLSKGFTEQRIGGSLIEQARRHAPRAGDSGPDATPRSEWTYDRLREGITSNQHSYNIGRMMRYRPLAIELFRASEAASR